MVSVGRRETRAPLASVQGMEKPPRKSKLLAETGGSRVNGSGPLLDEEKTRNSPGWRTVPSLM